jgi:WD40 repeat protein
MSRSILIALALCIVAAAPPRSPSSKVAKPIARPYVIKLDGHGWPVQAVAFSPDGKLLATGCMANVVKIWNLEKACKPLVCPVPRREKQDNRSIRQLAFTKDGKTVIAAGGQAGEPDIREWDVATGKCLRLFSFPDKPRMSTVWSMSLSPDGTRLATAGTDHHAVVWDVKKGMIKHLIDKTPLQREHKAVKWLDDKRLGIAGKGGVTLIDLDASVQVATIEVSGGVCDLAFHPTGRYIAMTCGTWLELGNLEKGKTVMRDRSEREWFCSPMFSKSGDSLAFLRAGQLRVVKPGTDIPVAFKTPEITAIAFDDAEGSEEARLAIGYRDGKVEVKIAP